MKQKIRFSSVLLVMLGIVTTCVGIGGLVFTHSNVVREKIVTPPDATLANTHVSGPYTLKVQADIIRVHTLRSTGDQTYAEMPQTVTQLDNNGKPIVGKDGKPVMIPNMARNIWITSTTLTTALNLGILAYAFSGLLIFLGIVLAWFGMIFYSISLKP